MTIFLLLLLTIKHFVFDFLYQPPFQWQNKGTWGHIGGILHSGQHAASTLLILLFFTSWPLAIGLSLGEFVIHYVTDWAKMNINKWNGWTATTHNEFWISLGADQLIHYLTYLAIAGIILL